MTKCPNCNSQEFYNLSDGRVKCKICSTKISLKKVEFKKKACELFCDDINSHESSKALSCSYQKISAFFMQIRKNISIYLQQSYEENQDKVSEFEEYIYLPTTKRKNEKYICEGIDILCFDYGGKIYTILLPSLNKYKNLPSYSVKNYFKINKLAKLKSKENNISRFCKFLEQKMKKFKGVDKKNFFYYLKEIEFKFNYSQNEQLKICYKLSQI